MFPWSWSELDWKLVKEGKDWKQSLAVTFLARDESVRDDSPGISAGTGVFPGDTTE